MADFVLVAGAWHGAWAWRRIVPRLWQEGHRAFTVPLTGVGERAHLFAPTVGLATHVQDVCAVLEAEELTQAVLVGHSYAGMVITGAADRLPSRVGRLVYVDASVPEPGESWASVHDEATRAKRREGIAKTGAIAPGDPQAFGLSGADAEWLRRRLTPQPGATYEEPLAFDPARLARLPRTFVDCHQPALPTIATSRRRVREQPGWRVVEIPTGHDPMVSAPDALVRALLDAAA